MTVTVKCLLTWEGMSKNFANQSEKKLKQVIKELTGAIAVDINEVTCTEDLDNEQ